MQKRLNYLYKMIQMMGAGYGAWVFYRLIRYLRSYLVKKDTLAITAAPLRWAQISELALQLNREFKQSSDKALCVHLYYSEIFFEILNLLKGQEQNFDFHISFSEFIDPKVWQKVIALRGRVVVYHYENKGRDVYPFVKTLPHLMHYEWVCKLHSKRSPKQRDGELWRKDLFADLLSEKSLIRLDGLSTQQKILAAQNSLLPVKFFLGQNLKLMQKILKKLNRDESALPELFIAGTMFWVRPQSLSKLNQLQANWDDLFEDERDVLDGTMAHAMERLFYFIAYQ